MFVGPRYFFFTFHIVHTSMNNMKDQVENLSSIKKPVITVYYDGLCKICSKEINHYRQQRGADRIQFVDICSPSFDAGREGLDPIQVHKVMHVRRQDGTIVTRVGAFIEIWSVIPKYHWLAKVSRQQPLKMALNWGYSCFAVVRPYLPRFSPAADCSQSPYCEVKRD